MYRKKCDVPGRKKLAILGTRGIPARYGGFETFAEELATRLAGHGVDVTVFCESKSGDQPALYKGVNLIYCAAPNLGPLSTIYFDSLCLWRARKDFDVVYMLGYGTSFFCILPRLWKRSVWINMDGIEWMREKWSALAKLYFKISEKIGVRIANRVIADAEGISAFLKKRHSFSTPCSVIPYGASVKKAEPNRTILDEHGLEPANYYLVVCRLEPENHIQEIIDGFAASATRSKLVIVGNSLSRTAYVQKLLQSRDKRIRFAGTVYDREKLTALRYFCVAYIHGHSVGGTNPSLLEALACGNVIIAHDNVFNREVAGEAGLYFNTTSDISALISRIESHTVAERSAMANTARARIEKYYTWEMITGQYLELLGRE